MREYTVKDIPSLIQAVQLAKQDLDEDLWFRGTPRATYNLVPSVHRRYSAKNERAMANRLRLGAPSRYRDCPRQDDLVGWLCLMQHFGLPTRLLDWTESPLVAAFFAVVWKCEKVRDCDAEIWCLDPERLNARQSPEEDDSVYTLDSFADHILVRAAFQPDLPPSDNAIAVVGPELDLRMTVQQGAFTMHGNPEPLQDRDGAEAFLCKFRIPADARAQLAAELRLLGISQAALFPDLPNLAEQIAREYLSPEIRPAKEGNTH